MEYQLKFIQEKYDILCILLKHQRLRQRISKHLHEFKLYNFRKACFKSLGQIYRIA